MPPLALSAATLMFTGEVTNADRDGNDISCKASLRGALFQTNLPILTRGRLCSHIKGSNNDGSFLISAGCALLKANWTFTTAFASVPVTTFPQLSLTTLARVTGPAPAYFANWFAGGRVTIGAGASFQQRACLASTNPAAGALIVTLDRAFNPAPAVSDVVKLYPACNGLRETCMAYDATTNPNGKFDNYLNFNGCWAAPVTDPSSRGQTNVSANGGKK